MAEPRRALAAPDKFRGTASAAEVAAAIGAAAIVRGWECDLVPVSDGGEGLLECFGGANRSDQVSGPQGRTVQAPWRLDGSRAVIEMATASGLALLDARNDPVEATTRGTGELIAAAIAAGAAQIIVGLGGSATTDGGSGALEVLRTLAPLDGSRGYRVQVAADVSTPFLAAAAVFGPQKGADPAQVAHLTERLQTAASTYLVEFGLDVTSIPGAGAAGGLAGGLAALGADVRSGFDLVADELGLAFRIDHADLVLTGEGRFDAASLSGKAPGGVLRLSGERHVPAALITGALEPGIEPPVPTVVLETQFGRDAAYTRTTTCIQDAAELLLNAFEHGTR